MENEKILEDELLVKLTIGNIYEEVQVKITDPNKTIRDQINSILQVFKLPKVDNCGNPIQYFLGKTMEDGEEPIILDLEDEDGRELCPLDYNIHPGDHLHLISCPIAYACPIPDEMQHEWVQYCLHNK